MSDSENQTVTDINTAVQLAYSRLLWMAPAEFGVDIPTIIRTSNESRVSQRRYIYLEPLVQNAGS